MKKSKWILLGAGIVVIIACVAVALSMFLSKDPANNADDQMNQTPGADAVHTVTVKTDDGKPAEGVGVYIYEDETKAELVWFDKTNAEGSMSFTAPEGQPMVAVLQNIPTGFAAEEFYPITGLNTEIVLVTGVMSEEDMENLTYKLGDRMMDFTIVDTDGKEHTLSELLETKKAVILNFWYINCDPCGMEFPYMQEAYEGYQKDIEILAMNPVDRDESAIAAYKKEKGLTFPVAMVDEMWEAMMQLTAYPTTVVIDRFGNISLIHKGMIDNADTFQQLFAYFTDDAYESKAIGSIEDILTESDVGTKENPFETGSFDKFEITVKPGETYYIRLFKQVEKFYLSVKGGDFSLHYKDKDYSSEDGELTLYIKPEGAFVPVELEVTNTTNKIQTYVLSKATPKGSYSNPYTLELGEFTSKLSAGNDQGLYYTYRMPEDGTLTIKCLEHTAGVEYDFTLYNLNSYVQTTLEGAGEVDEDGNRFLTIQGRKGQKIQFILNTLPDSSNNYPACTFKLLAQLNEGEIEEKYELPMTDYAITVTDEAGNPMSGVSMIFQGDFIHVRPVEEETEQTEKTETTEGEETVPEEYHIQVNQTLVTDEQGVAATQQVSGPYSVTIRVPEGYQLETTEYQLTAEAPTLSVQMKKLVKKDYTVTVQYPDGKPVANVAVQLGSEFKTTDATGTVAFNLYEGSHSISIATGIPEGYALPGNTTTFTFAQGESTLVLKLVGLGGKENPYIASQLPFTTKNLAAGETVYVCIDAPVHYADAPVLTVADPDAKVSYNGQEYTADPATGSLQVAMTQSDAPVLLAVTNAGNAEKRLEIDITYPVGTRWNPQPIDSLEQIILSTAEGDEDGYYYQYTNENAGDLTLQVANVNPEGAAYEVTVTTETSGTVPVTDAPATVYMKLGEAALIHVRALPVEVEPEQPDPDPEPDPEEPAEQTLMLPIGETYITLAPDTNYVLRVDLGENVPDMAGTLTWTGDVTVTENGVEVSSPYDLSGYNPRVGLLATVEAETAVIFTVTPPAETADLQLILGENAIDTNYDGVAAGYTATEEGTYVLSAADGETNAYVMLAENAESIDLPYTFTLTAGETKSFLICTNETGDDTIDLVLEQKSTEPVEAYMWLYEGENAYTLEPNTNYNLSIDLGSLLEPAGTLEWSTGVTVTANGAEIASGWDLAGYSKRVMLVATVETETAAVFTITLPEEEAAPELILGNNAVEVTDAWGGAVVAVSTAGDYTLSAAEDEENALVMRETAYGSEEIELPYTFTLTDGETQNFIVYTTGVAPDTVNLVLSEASARSKMTKIAKPLAEEPVIVIPALEIELIGSFTVDSSALPEGDQLYTVTVTDHAGKPLAGVLVQIKQNGEQKAVGMTNAFGQVQTVLTAADYTVEVAASGATKYHYEEKLAVLPLGTTKLSITMTSVVPTPSGRPEDSYIIGAAPDVGLGATYVSGMQINVPNYFVFTPEIAGKYRFTTSDPDAIISYWSGTVFPYERTTEYVADGNYVDVNIYKDMLGGADCVIGITGAEDAILLITRVGDPDFRKEDLPVSSDWKNDYKPEASAVPNISGKTITHINIKDQSFDTSRITVVNGLYYLDGKPLYINLNDDAPGFSLKVVMKGKDGESYGGSGLSKYFQDENGNWVRYENYTSCLDEYLQIVLKKQDGERFYPLTENLAHILQNYCTKWWEDPTGGDYQAFFDDANLDIAWLYCCCTIE